MILFPDDIQAINNLLRQRADLDPELWEACQEHIGHGQYADAVFKAFRLLEGRIQQRSGIQGETASRLLNEALATRGPLTQKLGLTSQQAANYRDLLKGAFAVFRNPEAHPGEAIFDYGSAECQAVLAFVNLMLGVLDRQPDTPLDKALKQIRRDIGPDAAERLKQFLNQVLSLDLKPDEQSLGIALQARVLRSTELGTPPRWRYTTVFTVRHGDGNPYLMFPIHDQWPRMAKKYDSFVERLLDVGFVQGHWPTELNYYLQEYNNSAEALRRVETIMRDVVTEMKQAETMQPGDGK